MDQKETETFAASVIPKDRLDIICIIEIYGKHHAYEIIQNRNSFSLINNFAPSLRMQNRRH